MNEIIIRAKFISNDWDKDISSLINDMICEPTNDEDT